MINVYGIADSILIVGYDAVGRDHNRTLKQVMQICHKENLKLNKNECHFRCTKIPFLEEVILREGVQLDPKKLCTLTEMPPKIKRIAIILGTMNYIKKLSPSTTEVCKPLQKLASLKCEWTWNSRYQNLYDKAKNINKKNVTSCVAFCNVKQQPYFGRDASGVSLGICLLQVRDRMWFPRNEAPNNVVLWSIAFASKNPAIAT